MATRVCVDICLACGCDSGAEERPNRVCTGICLACCCDSFVEVEVRSISLKDTVVVAELCAEVLLRLRLQAPVPDAKITGTTYLTVG